MAEKLVIELTREKETPGTVRFQGQDPDEDSERDRLKKPEEGDTPRRERA